MRVNKENLKKEKNTNMERRNKEKEINCLKCRAEFDIWLANSNFPMDVEDKIKKRFYNYCGVCKAMQKKKKGRTKEA